MSVHRARGPSFWGTVRLLLEAASKRSAGRRQRQQQLLQNRSDGKGTDWSGFVFLFFVLFMLFINGAAAFVLNEAVKTAQRVETEQQGKIVVSKEFFEFAAPSTAESDSNQESNFDESNSQAYSNEAKRISEKCLASSDLPVSDNQNSRYLL
jgi:hypothetical protein